MNHKSKLSRRELLMLGAGTAAAKLAGCGTNASKSGEKKEKRPLSKHLADTIIFGGTVATMDKANPKVEAVALKNGRIIAVGNEKEVLNLRGTGTTMLDLEGGLVLPGLVDAHGHVVSLGKSLEQVDLRGAKSVEEVVERINKHGATGNWIMGRGWDQNLFEDKQMPSHKPLSVAFPDRPVWLTRIDGHAGWGNEALFKACSINAKTKAPLGGEILKDTKGNPLGVLVDMAMDLVSIPELTEDDLKRLILKALDHLAVRGITGVHDMGISQKEDAVYKRLAASEDPSKTLNIRIVSYAEQKWFFSELLRQKSAPRAEESVYDLMGVKLYADGALGSRGAYMLEPYSDRKGHLGLLITDPKELEEMSLKAMEAGWQVATHAIGDAANRIVLDAYSKAASSTGQKDHRFRVEHCQILNPVDIPRFAEHSVIASMQPTHATSDMPWVESRVGKDRLDGAYAWRSLLNSQARLCFGSDFPVEQVDITFGLYSAITRQDASGEPEGGWMPKQKLFLNEAMEAFSSGPAYASRREAHLGIIKPGFQADITCFKKNLFDLPALQIPAAPVLATIVRGKIVFQA